MWWNLKSSNVERESIQKYSYAEKESKIEPETVNNIYMYMAGASFLSKEMKIDNGKVVYKHCNIKV